MKVYFVIPTYNVEEYLARCIDSVLAQTYKDVEIVLVDDGSPDSCPKICDSYAEKYENIIVIHKENGGLSDARNAGIGYVLKNASEKDFITFLDADDFVHPEYAKRMVSVCECCSCNISQCEYEKGCENSFTETCDWGDCYCTSAEKALLGYTIKSQSCAKLYRANLFKDVRFPVGVINEDEFITYRLIYNAGRIAIITDKLYYYYQHDTGIMADVAKKLKDNPHRYDYLKAYEERIAFFEEREKSVQVMKTHEKICTDIILRYCEQMYLKRNERDTDCVNGKYIKIYRENYALMIKRKGMPIKRKLMYIGFRIFPYSAVIMGKIFTLRK